MSNNSFDFIIVGAGIVGAATAYKLQQKYPDARIALLEKENSVAMHQTGRNSGVIHSGIYYTPGSYKALNCKNGREQLIDYAEKHNIAYDICGKIILATREEELPALEKIYRNGMENATPGIRYFDTQEIQEFEPYALGIRAIHVPSAGIIDYVATNRHLAESIHGNTAGSRLILSCEVKETERKDDISILHTTQGKLNARKVVFCTGLQADRMARMDGIDADMRIVGFRGDYYRFKDESRHKVHSLIYPVPDPRYPFLGVHFTKMIDGGVECGPNAVFSFAREGYGKTAFDLRDTTEALTYAGTWRLFKRHIAKGIDEYKRAFSKKLFIRELRKMMPELKDTDVVPGKSGIRAQAIDRKGDMVDDFVIREAGNNIHVLNAPSPAATACLAIADEIIKRC